MHVNYPDYLMIASRYPSCDLAGLPEQALAELGGVMARVEWLLKEVFQPYKVIFSKFGFSEGYPLHFHALHLGDDLERLIGSHSSYTNDMPDGIDMFLFVNREHCEDQNPDLTNQLIKKSVSTLKSAMSRYEKI